MRSARARVTRDDVVTAARELLDAEGAGGLSMARLGQRLGVTAMALYRHVEDRHELESAVVAQVLADLVVDVDPDEPWDHAVERWMRQVRAHWLAHPWVGHLLGTDAEIGAPWLAVLDTLAQALGRAGLSPAAVARELAHTSRTTVGVVQLEIRAPLAHAAGHREVVLDRVDAMARGRWAPLVDELARYGDGALFDDLVLETLARVRRLAAAEGGPQEGAGPSATRRARRLGATST